MPLDIILSPSHLTLDISPSVGTNTCLQADKMTHKHTPLAIEAAVDDRLVFFFVVIRNIQIIQTGCQMIIFEKVKFYYI